MSMETAWAVRERVKEAIDALNAELATAEQFGVSVQIEVAHRPNTNVVQKIIPTVLAVKIQ